MDRMSVIRLVLMFLANLNAVLVSKGLQPIPLLDEQTAALVVAFFFNLWGFFAHNFIDKDKPK